MTTISLTFFEEYKHLEKFCNEIYGQTNGVTLYINDMEARGLRYGGRISKWSSDLKQLKHLRHIRNRLAHDGSFDDDSCTYEDIEYLRSFYDRLMHSEDPLALARKLDDGRPARRPVHSDKSRPVLPDEKADVEPAAKGCFVVILIAAAVIIAVILLGWHFCNIGGIITLVEGLCF